MIYCGLDSSGSGQGQVVVSSEHGTEATRSIICVEFLVLAEE
jgi:hypothetical protein